ncbi:hypothetical protein CHI12_09480 [Terribacillus saccharophilus]|uniref:Uncharacterized protein n=1 Tax=Terribacillus saccharophilus TaxID=361277 RepID=A0A268HD48_9BACI|nr:hypothetical protein [Terribacillus saccharophilus]PAE07788.1 hypothetical protein CHI12_09480 [Terribacillus saccharophilus]
MSGIHCLVCRNSNFVKGYYDIDSTLNVYPDNSLDTDIDNDICMRTPDRENKYSFRDKYNEIFSYVCEECGYIMSFTEEKKVYSKKEEAAQKQRDSAIQWKDF